MLHLQLLGTLGCHLCDAAEQVLLDCLDLNAVQVEVLDIAESDDLLACFAMRIPVLRHAPSDTCLDWPFQASQVENLVRQLS
ncbi:MAG: glutaredoxin family protein [Gammaproteobacteria bacterium]|jgi:hypothetical protein|nr:glutaredoxin family protein [Gammaproteobacteria bacterium]